MLKIMDVFTSNSFVTFKTEGQRERSALWETIFQIHKSRELLNMICFTILVQ